MKIYIAGPLTKGDTILNIRKGIEIADILANMGHTPFVPHLFSAWHTIFPHDYDFWMKLDLEWLRDCDALIRLPGESLGADIEVKEAEKLGIPIYYTTNEIGFNQETFDVEKFKQFGKKGNK